MKAAEKMYEQLAKIEVKPGAVAMVWLDFGPNTIAENQAQADVIIEHLLRRRIPTVLISQYQQSEAFLRRLPATIAERLEKEDSNQKWRYGEDWINAGYKPGSALFMQSLAKSNDITTLLGKDVNATPLSAFPKFAKIRSLTDISIVAEVTGLMGVFDNIIQFFQREGYRPVVVHGCTSITVPEAYIFLDSGQLNGLLEGLAGAAWYSKLLKDQYPSRANDSSLVRNSALSIAQLGIIFLIVAGNLAMFFNRKG